MVAMTHRMSYRSCSHHLPSEHRVASTALLSVAGVGLQLIPSLAQSSGVVLAVTVPVHVALAIAMWRLDPDDAVRRRASVPLQRAV